MTQIHWNEKSKSLWPWPLYKCTKIAIWNFAAAGAFVFHLAFFRYLTRSRVIHFPFQYMSSWHSILQYLIDQRGRWIYTDAHKSVKWLVDKSQYIRIIRCTFCTVVWWTVGEINKNQQCLPGNINIPEYSSTHLKPFCYGHVSIKFTEFSETLRQEWIYCTHVVLNPKIITFCF